MKTHMLNRVLRGLLLAVTVIGVASAGTASAASLTGPTLIAALSRGGCVLVMRHTSSPRTMPDKSIANPDNVKLERQLDENGRATAKAMGEAIRTLPIPVGDVFSSPTYRARETVRNASLGNPQFVEELGDAGQGMQVDTACGKTGSLIMRNWPAAGLVDTTSS